MCWRSVSRSSSALQAVHGGATVNTSSGAAEVASQAQVAALASVDDLLNRIGSSHDLESILGQVSAYLAVCGVCCPGAHVSLSLLNSSRSRLVRWVLYGDSTPLSHTHIVQSFPDPGTSSTTSIMRAACLVIHSVSSMSDVPSDWKVLADEHHMNGFAVVPVIPHVGGRVLGSLSVWVRDDHGLSAAGLCLMRIVAMTLAGRLELLRERVNESTALISAMSTVSSLSELIGVTLEAVMAQSPGVQCSVAISSASRKTLNVYSPDQSEPVQLPFARTDYSCASVITSGEALLIADATQMDSLPPDLEESSRVSQLRSFLVSPMHAGSQVIGTINLASVEANRFYPDFVQFVANLGNTAAVHLNMRVRQEQGARISPPL